jgi:hypothetical protein
LKQTAPGLSAAHSVLSVHGFEQMPWAGKRVSLVAFQHARPVAQFASTEQVAPSVPPVAESSAPVSTGIEVSAPGPASGLGVVGSELEEHAQSDASPATPTSDP